MNPNHHTHEHDHNDHHDDHHDLGLQADLDQWTRDPIDRRRALQLGLVGLGAVLIGCNPATGTGNTSGGVDANGCVSKIPTETAGPFPGDGSNGANALTRSGIVRSDIRSTLSSGKIADGVPMTFELTLVNSSASCAPLIGYAIYLWHCDRDGNYSMYGSIPQEDYLRGVQATDSSGKALFKSIFPACYSGRWPHVHFEIYPSLEKAMNVGNKILVSQLALPEAVCSSVYASASGYSQSTRNLSQTSLARDNVFSDGSSLQLANVTGDELNGYSAKLTIGIGV
jgi:protocatechuate 3,4-dioxygenase beta subunit